MLSSSIPSLVPKFPMNEVPLQEPHETGHEQVYIPCVSAEFTRYNDTPGDTVSDRSYI